MSSSGRDSAYGSSPVPPGARDDSWRGAGTRPALALEVVEALVAVVVGVLLLVAPDRTVSFLATLFGLYLLAAGAVRLAVARLRTGRARLLWSLFGAITLAAGVVVLLRPGDGVRPITVLFAAWLVTAALAAAAEARLTPARRASATLHALIALLTAIVLLAAADAARATIAAIIGAALLLSALVALAGAIRARRAGKP